MDRKELVEGLNEDLARELSVIIQLRACPAVMAVLEASEASERNPAGGSAAGEVSYPCCPPPPDQPFHTRRIPPDREPDAASFDPRMSADGRFVVFVSAATNLPGANGNLQVYRFEQGASSTSANIVHVSLDTDGNPAGADCRNPSISNDGQRVVFETAAQLDLADDDDGTDTDGLRDIYLRNVSTGTTVRLTAPLVPGQRGESFGAAIAGNGQFAAFTSAASDLHSFDSNEVEDVFRVAINTDAPWVPWIS